ncbi:hemerythrin domain-containing protein [Aromatoleum bremense]|uniref:Hemerythrin domain-containing protein n=1 Tax=Aromatoleum bremense TaxID=76115 RepID=A0ABX1P0M9_9RHOO|nr:hemerythrin domain-containing protein [Aromatoleum bremense]NMG17452.1 hemerythrin domain-containing protein [Aromatoleum bremense]QTQ32579.1 hemerythrin-like domain-containing protein [Aromatoleum bremense]
MNPLMRKLSPSATNMIRTDHSHVLSVFHQYETDTSPQTKKALVNSACLSLEIHAQLEEEIFYPAMRQAMAESATVDKSVSEHEEMRRLIAQLRGMEPTDPQYDETFMSLMRDVLHHAAEEETIMLPKAERLLGNRLAELGAEMMKRRLELSAPHAGEIAMNGVRTMHTGTLLMTTGAAVAGAYLVKKVFERGHHHA